MNKMIKIIRVFFIVILVISGLEFSSCNKKTDKYIITVSPSLTQYNSKGVICWQLNVNYNQPAPMVSNVILGWNDGAKYYQDTVVVLPQTTTAILNTQIPASSSVATNVSLLRVLYSNIEVYIFKQ